ncbi:MAG: penicillin-binding protein activator, partial [Gammaproteobacteria bacterium]|nr:penicillin-binding protein activator [Gammaproteobacteria bacterium]
DSGDGQINIAELYARAVADGAQVVVGPLAKPAVEQLAGVADLQVPVLALNRIDITGASPKFYQFGLPPEDEATAIAQRAVSAGLTRALVITTEGAWGDRVSQAFQTALAEAGGQALTVARLPATSSDYRDILQGALLLDQSLARRNDINARIGTRVEFEPRRRDDVQVILVAGDDRQMRSLRPQLEFHHAEDLPIIAVSNIYSGFADANADRDLNGVVFTDSPWRIDDATIAPSERLLVDRFWPERNAQAGNLFALGVDAYRLLPYVPRLANASGTTIDGASGNLFVDTQRQVHRQPIFAVFKNGVPVRAPELTPQAVIEPITPQL